MVPVYAVLATYVLGFALFPPRVLSVVDEERYVSQAMAFAQGRTTIEGSGIIIPAVHLDMISDYPVGTALLQAPLVWMLGWRGAVLLSVISLIATTLVTAFWLRDRGKAPLFALLIPSFIAAGLFGRVAMSDMPGAALVAVTCWMIWRSEGRRPLPSLAAGLASGTTLLFREPLAVLLAPLLIGAVLRAKVHVPALVAGGLAGVAARLILSYAFFGDAWYVRDPGIGFSIDALGHTLPMYAFILLIVFPTGGALPLFYRGDRRPELTVAIAAYVMLFLLYDYDVVSSHGSVKGALLASRFMIPLTPLLAWMAADVWPRLVERASAGVRSPAALVTAASMAVALIAFAIHPIAHGQERDSVRIIRGMFDNTNAATPVITNSDATLKYFGQAYGTRRLILRQGILPDTVPALLDEFRSLSVAFLDRVDSELFRIDADANDRFLVRLSEKCRLRARHREDLGWASLRVFDVLECPRRPNRFIE